MRRLIVLEVNEIPRRVIDWWVREAPTGALARFVDRADVVDTHLAESLPRDLYPSQSWASVSTGVPWADHGVFWYGDPKPDTYPFYWQAAAAAGRTVGTVGVLHSSPIDEQAGDPNLVFVVPDAFATEPDTRPADLRGLQELNLRASRQSARVATLRPSVADVATLGSVVRAGLAPGTSLRLGGLAAQVAAGRIGKERLRAGQTMLLGDVFRRQIRRFDPDLAVTFTNHVAAAMHRYWAATFPEDFPRPPYDDGWRAAHADELPFAMRVLDREIDRTVRLAERTDRSVVIVSSMGQHADLEVDTDVRFQAVVRDGDLFLAGVGLADDLEVNAAMVPQLTITASDRATAADLERTLRERLGESITELMTSGRAVTITYDLPVVDGREGADAPTEIRLGRRTVRAADVGVSIESITDHRSGRHHPDGVLLSDRPTGLPGRIDAFEIAPWLLRQLDVEPLPHHRGGGAGADPSPNAVDGRVAP